jgi:hypothetical protein
MLALFQGHGDKTKVANAFDPVTRLIACIALIVMVAGCATSSNPSEAPKVIFVAEGARDLRESRQSSGQIDVMYRVQEKYPAVRIRDDLARTLQAAGFRVLDHDYLDPDHKQHPDHKQQIPRQWSSYVDGRKRTESCVLRLVEDWQNTDGDVVRYALTYESPCKPVSSVWPDATVDTLEVTAIVIPAALVRVQREAAKKLAPRRRAPGSRPASSIRLDGIGKLFAPSRPWTLNRLVTARDECFSRDRPHAATANAVVSERTSHSRQRRRITQR